MGLKKKTFELETIDVYIQLFFFIKIKYYYCSNRNKSSVSDDSKLTRGFTVTLSQKRNTKLLHLVLHKIGQCTLKIFSRRDFIIRKLNKLSHCIKKCRWFGL